MPGSLQGMHPAHLPGRLQLAAFHTGTGAHLDGGAHAWPLVLVHPAAVGLELLPRIDNDAGTRCRLLRDQRRHDSLPRFAQPLPLLQAPNEDNHPLRPHRAPPAACSAEWAPLLTTSRTARLCVLQILANASHLHDKYMCCLILVIRQL